MVFRGVPSKACLPCRKKKLRCDLQTDGCGQCRRAQVTCIGYRDPSGLRVQNETDKARNQVLARNNDRVWNSVTMMHPAGLKLACEAQSRAAFFSFYIFGLTRTNDVLPSLYDQAAPGSPLAESVDAVSLAFVADHYGQRSLSVMASEKYLAALHQVNQALQDPCLAVQDSTLQSVLLLDLYEKMVNRDHLSRLSWMSHVSGALSLVQARGDANLNTHIGRRLATRLVITLSISCGAVSLRIPDELMELWKKLDPYSKRTDAKWLATKTILRFLNLKADIAQGCFSSNDDILVSLIEMESEFVSTRKRIAPVWKLVQVHAQAYNPLVYGSFHDVYTDHFVTQASNVFRIMRLLLHNMIQGYIPKSPMASRMGITAEESRAVMEEMAEEICAAVPQFILPEARPDNAIPFTPLQTLQCYAMVPPLYAAGQLSQSPRLRTWVLKILNHIAVTGGMQMAKQVADVLEKNSDTPYWGVYTMLGSYAFAP